MVLINKMKNVNNKQVKPNIISHKILVLQSWQVFYTKV